MRVIGLVGRAGVGKSTLVADTLAREYGYARIAFTDPIVAMLRAIGLTDADLGPDAKDRPCDRLGGHTPREAMRRLGYDWGQGRIDPDLWVGLTLERIAEADGPVVIEGVRRHREAEIVRGIGGTLWRVRAPWAEPTGWRRWLERWLAHPIEREIAQIATDATILNLVLGEPGAVREQVRALMAGGATGGGDKPDHPSQPPAPPAPRPRDGDRPTMPTPPPARTIKEGTRAPGEPSLGQKMFGGR